MNVIYHLILRLSRFCGGGSRATFTQLAMSMRTPDVRTFFNRNTHPCTLYLVYLIQLNRNRLDKTKSAVGCKICEPALLREGIVPNPAFWGQSRSSAGTGTTAGSVCASKKKRHYCGNRHYWGTPTDISARSSRGGVIYSASTYNARVEALGSRCAAHIRVP